MSSLSWRHHTLIQSLLSKGPLKESEFRSIFTKITANRSDNERLFHDYLKKINSNLAYVQFELRAFRNQYDGTVYYGVVNNVADEQSKLGTKYTVPQIAFYKGIIEAIIQDDTAKGSISNIDALNTRLENQVPNGGGTESQGVSSQVPAAFRNFSLSQKERTLDELVRDKWLCATSDGRIGLGVRSFLDLRSWFRNNDVPACDVCNEAGVKADACSNESCNVRIHNYCLTRKFSQRRAERICPGCGTQWEYTVPKSEFVVHDEEELPNGNSQNQPPPKPPARKKQRHNRTADDMSETGPSQNCTVKSEMRTTRRSSRLTGANQS
ncbi:hypothetical protein POM88_018933 [Heracleum sosnowskyi]|uniref:Non-structural maintenance of chromosomes element 1 homolog n=1 Tax=Heracleum sosnowskyi TaxID=360622 RepID=A0AAD8IRZ2_9APIA|nr:hypothetical protein POM88_018933 [Heracleum sosnowskyi]